MNPPAARTDAALRHARDLERQGRLDDALAAYAEAFDASGKDAALAGDIGRLALRLGQYAIAEQLFLIHLTAEPASLDSRLHLAHALREQHRYDEAVAALTPAVEAHPEEPALWSALGTVLVQQGRPGEALAFLDEAVRLRPQGGGQLYARANAYSDLGDHPLALADYQAALADLSEADKQRVRVPMALSQLALGDLPGGWDGYRARLSRDCAKPVVFLTPAAPWPFDPDKPPDALKGRSLLLLAEQGLGDEVMFANVVPDVLEALGPNGRLTLSVEPRLVPLFARSFPTIEVVGHRTWTADGLTYRQADGPQDHELWAPLAAPLRQFRRAPSDFPDRPYLIPDPARVIHWRALLSQRPGRKVGILWKSLKLQGERLRQFAPFAQWAPVLTAPGVSFVNLQYGDCAQELAEAYEELGVKIWQPPGIDLKDDLDDVAALCCALDLTLGFANATINLAGACGARSWLIAAPTAWPKLGTDRYPWYPQMQVISSAIGWETALEEAGAMLGGGNAA